MFGIGSEIAGYRVESVLGAGGMGEVYKVRHPRLPRSDAIKVLRSAHGSDPVVRQRFEREADLLAPLAHPNLVRVYDRGGFGDVLWIAMELVDGTDAARLSKASPAGMDPRLVVNIVNGVAAALDTAHRHGVLHRDIKPANILITPGDDPVRPESVKVTDFGIAQALGDASAGLTSTGTTVGTMRYCSPEQIDGRGVDGRADVYSLAATTFELLTGAPPYDATSLQGLMTAHLFAEPPRVSSRVRSLPPAVDAVLQAGLAKDPAARPPTATAFAHALYAAFTGIDVRLTPAQTFAHTPGAPVTGPQAYRGQPGMMVAGAGSALAGPPSSKWYARIPVVASLAVVAALLLGVGGAFVWNAGSSLSTPNRPDATMTADGVKLSWQGVPGADQYLVKRDDVVVATTTEPGATLAEPLAGTHRFSVAARSAVSGGSGFSTPAELTVTQTWGPFHDIAALYPELVPKTPVSTNAFESLSCRGMGAYPAGSDDAARLIACDKIVGGDTEYTVVIGSGTDPSKTRSLAYRELSTIGGNVFRTAQGTRGSLNVGVENNEAKAVLTFYSSDDDEPRSKTYVAVYVPNSKNAAQARAIMERLPF